MKFRILLLLSIFVFVVPCYGDILGDVLAVAEQQSKVSETDVGVPDPLNLDPNWWNYYAGPDVKWDKTIADTEKALEALSVRAPSDDKSFVDAYIHKILVNLQALPKARSQKIEAEKPAPFFNTYTLDQQFEVVARLREVEGELEESQKEAKQLTERTKRARTQIDTLYSSYMSMREPNYAKVQAGLEVMAGRMALAVTEETLRLVSERVSQYEQLQDYYQKELQFALEHLAVTEYNDNELVAEIDQSKSVLKEAKMKASLAEMNALGSFGETDVSRARAYLLAQASVLSSVKEALAELDLIFLEAKRSLLEVVSDSEKYTLDDFSTEIADWGEAVNNVRNQLPDWESKSTQELERGLHAYSETSSELDNIQTQRHQEVQETIKDIKQLKLRDAQINLILHELQDRLVVSEGWLAKAWSYTEHIFDSCCDPILGWMSVPLLKIGGVPINVLSLLRIIAIMAATMGISGLFRRIVDRLRDGQLHLNESSIFVLKKVVHYTILCLGFALALASIGLSLSSLAIVLGALSVGIGFGLQTIVNNFFSSLIILFSRTLKVGDFVELHSQGSGQVTDINIQNTVIHTKDGTDIIVPNSEIISNRLVNWTLKDNFRRLHIPFGVAYDSDKEKVCQVVSESAKKVPCTVTNSDYYSDPQVWLVGFGDSCLNFELVVWVNVYGFGHKGSMKASFIWEIENALRENKISIPFPQREVRILSNDSPA